MDNTLAMTLQPQSLEPTAEDVAMLTRQYQKALDGLYEAYRFGMMLRAVKERLDAADGAGACAAPTPPAEAQGASPRPAPTGADFVDAEMGDGHDARTEGFSGESARGLAREMTVGRNGNILHEGGWNRGTGLKAWLARYCPEINYSTAKRFLAVAEKTVAALALADAEAEGGAATALPDAPQGRAPGDHLPFTDYHLPGGAAAPDENAVRAFLAGKSQRTVLRLGGKREGAGRKAKDWAAALNAAPEIAWKELSEPLDRLSDLIVRERRHAALTAQNLHTLRDAIDLLHEVIHVDA